jgi:hypothetical protein
VRAAAGGVVRAVRDGEPDLSVDQRGRANLAGKDAGNSVVIVHGGGWESQYSHLREGSVRVAPREKVVAGQALGLIGLSGNTNVPHLNFALRWNGQVIDPFLGPFPGRGCEAERAPLWRPATLAALPYRPSGLLLAGFVDGVPDKAIVRDGGARATAFGPDAPALSFYADVYGLRAGDTELFAIIGPGGREVVRVRKVLEADAHQHLNYAGRKRPPGGWPPGVYRGEYQLLREVDGKPQKIVSVTPKATISAR